MVAEAVVVDAEFNTAQEHCHGNVFLLAITFLEVEPKRVIPISQGVALGAGRPLLA